MDLESRALGECHEKVALVVDFGWWVVGMLQWFAPLRIATGSTAFPKARFAWQSRYGCAAGIIPGCALPLPNRSSPRQQFPATTTAGKRLPDCSTGQYFPSATAPELFLSGSSQYQRCSRDTQRPDCSCGKSLATRG